MSSAELYDRTSKLHSHCLLAFTTTSTYLFLWEEIFQSLAKHRAAASSSSANERSGVAPSPTLWTTRSDTAKDADNTH